MDKKENYKARLLRRAIILCWVLLALCLVVKIFGGNYFNIVCENENFIKFCNFVDNSILRYVLYYFSFFFINAMLIYICNPYFKICSKNGIVYIIFSLFIWTAKVICEYFSLNNYTLIYNIISFPLTYLLIYVGSKKPLLSLFAVIYDFVLAMVSSVVKSISISGNLTNSFLLTSIFMIDYYILLILSVLYRKYKRGD